MIPSVPSCMHFPSHFHWILTAAVVCGFLAAPLSYAQEDVPAIVPSQAGIGLLRKTVDRTEVLPGDQIHFTLRVQNVLLSIIDDAEIVERFDPSILTVVSAQSAENAGGGSLRWSLPRLGPGEVWEADFVLQVSADATHETVISTITTLTGQDIQNAPLQEMVAIVNVNVVELLPSTGASYDLLLLLASLPLALSLSTVQRLGRRKHARESN